MKSKRYSLLAIFLLLTSIGLAQPPTKLSATDELAVNELFVKGNTLLKNGDYAKAVTEFEAALKILPDEPSILYNGGFSALLAGSNQKAVELLSRLTTLEPDDWLARAKLIQAYENLNKTAERDREREALFAIRKAGKNSELNEQIEYCRDRFEAGGRYVMAFEMFEFKGSRAIRYAFRVMDTADRNKVDHTISLGSYDLTNNIWRETTKPTPKEGERLFHLDGYFRNGHATYGMMKGEPTYDATKKMVIDILEKKVKPASSSVVVDKNEK